MKQLFLFLCLFPSMTLFSQQYRHAAGNASQLALTNIPADIEVHASNGNEIQLTFIAEDGKTVALPGNSGLGLQVTSSGSSIEIKGMLSRRVGGRYLLEVPKRLVIDVNSDGLMKSFTAEGMQGDFNITTTDNVTLEDMEGGITVQSADGNVAIKKPALAKDKPISVITQAGNVSITLHGGANADLKLGTATGHIMVSYQQSKNGMLLFNGKRLNTPIGKGGPVLQVQTLSGNVSVMQAQ